MITQTNDIPIASPVLSYATHDADGTPDWVPEAEARIEKNCRPSGIRDLFSTTLHAARYFGKSMSRRYGHASIGERPCASCGAATTSFAISVLWTATVHPAPLQLSVRGDETSPFETWHPLCTSCVTPWVDRLTKSAIRRRRIHRLQLGLFCLWVVALLAGRTVVRSYFPRSQAADDWLPITSIVFVVLMVLLAIVERVFIRGVPRYFRKLMPRDVQFNGLHSAFRCVDGKLVSLW